MASPSNQKLELLAPAGSIEAFFAALEAGADAVYCGLREFSARAKARNFTLAEMDRLSAAAHAEGRRLYVALNTLVKEAELPRLLEVLAGLAACRVDGLIIQDLGVWRLARDHFPELPLHASTQMTIHNLAGVEMLGRMGFQRGVLARELTLPEIAAIGGQSPIELEHFVHGALCYSVSGHCFFSSHLAGKSGNRGRCLQPCRRRSHHRGKPGFYFSTNDLGAIEWIPRLAAAGVMSFKIEGRMKNAEYVAGAVSAYRKVLDALPSDRDRAVLEAREILAGSYGRRPTAGFLRGAAPADLINPSRKGGIGLELGSLEKSQAGEVLFRTGEVVHVGDRLRIQPEDDLAGTSFTVRELFVGSRRVKRAGPKSLVRIPTPFRGKFQAGDLVYKVSTGKTFSLSEEACRRRLERAVHPPARVGLSLRFEGKLLCLEAVTSSCAVSRNYEVEMHPALQSPLTRDILRQAFEKTGHAGLILDEFVAGDLPAVVIPPSRLKEIRRDLYGSLAVLMAGCSREQLARRIDEARRRLLPPRPPEPADRAGITVIGAGFQDLTILEDREVGRLVLPLVPENNPALSARAERFCRDRSRIVWEIPSLIFEGEWQSFRAAVTELAGQGFSRFRLNNLGHLRLFDHLEGISRTGGPLLYVLNSQAALALKELGLDGFTFSMEDDRKNMADILSREIALKAAAMVYSPVPLLTSRIPPGSVGSGDLLESDRGEPLRLEVSRGLTTVWAGQDFSLAGHLAELREMGCGELVLDLSRAGTSSGPGREILEAVKEDRALAGTSTFNFERGLE